MGAQNKETDRLGLNNLESEICGRIYRYANICSGYAQTSGMAAESYQRYLNLNVFKVCLLSSFTEGVINKSSDFIKELDWLLWNQFIEEDGNDRLIKIAGYFALDKQVSSFSLINILFYNHVLKDYENSARKDFLDTMILYPCYRKIMNLDDSHRSEVMDYLGFTKRTEEIPRENLGGIKERTKQSFDNWKRRLEYDEYIDIMEISEYRTAAVEGAEIYVASWSSDTREECGGKQNVQNE